MIEGLKPYAESATTKPITRTSDINIPWLTAIPEHWKVVRSKGLFTARTERARPDDEQLSATQAYGVIPQKEFESRVGRKVVRITQNLEKRAHVEPDDFVISMRSFQGGLERAWSRGCIRSSYVVLKPSPEAQVGYFAHLFKSLDYIRALQATSNFIRDGQDLNFNNFSLVDLPLPPLDEQATIAKCLDHANRKIDGFIRAKRKLIGLLNEQKQAIIHRAVTRGLDPDTPLKPSGVPWLGDIPRHWEIVRNMALFAHRVESGISGLPVLQVSLRSGISAEELDQFGRPKKLIADARKYKRIHQGDVAYNTMRMWQGAVGVSPCDGLVSPAYVVLKARQDTCPVFYDFVFHTEVYKQQVNRQSTGIVSDRNRLYWDSFKEMPNLTLPRAEQEDIVAFIVDRTTHLNTAIARTEREIALMQEYRTRLTADIVTGKLDVREAAATLPELPAEPFTDETPGDSDMLNEIESEES
jgi:type I restriction enzyme S subunit